jgi:hypothetical protein
VFELAFWQSIQNSKEPTDFASYLEKYPNGQFASLARSRQRLLQTAAQNEDSSRRAEEQRRAEDQRLAREREARQRAEEQQLAAIEEQRKKAELDRQAADEQRRSQEMAAQRQAEEQHLSRELEARQLAEQQRRAAQEKEAEQQRISQAGETLSGPKQQPGAPTVVAALPSGASPVDARPERTSGRWIAQDNGWTLVVQMEGEKIISAEAALANDGRKLVCSPWSSQPDGYVEFWCSGPSFVRRKLSGRFPELELWANSGSAGGAKFKLTRSAN